MRLSNLPYIRSKDPKLYETIKEIQNQTTAIERQTNSNATGHPPRPPAINRVQVSTGPGGEFQIAITDNGQVGRGINYWAEHDTSPTFQNPHIIDMGQSRNHSIYLGSQKLYWRAYSSYPGSLNSAHAYHGDAGNPQAVQGGVPGLRAPSMGSGTSAEGYGGTGPGPIQRRSKTSGYDWNAQKRSTS